LSFSECLQLERSPIGSGGGGRAAKVLSVLEGMPAYLHCPRQREGGSNLKVFCWADQIKQNINKWLFEGRLDANG
jgi:hypothetical protein